MRKFIFISLIFFITINSFSQGFTVPKNYTLEKEEDFKLLEKDILNAISWLCDTPVNEQAEKRIDANSFLVKWLTDCPYIRLEVNTKIVNFFKTSDLLIIFMGGWTKYSIESGNYDDKIAGNLAGIETVINFYKKNRKLLPKDKNVEEYIKMQEKGTLKEYIEKYA